MIKISNRLICTALAALFVFCHGAMAQNDYSEQYAQAMELFSIASSTSDYQQAYKAFKQLEDKMPDEADIHYRLAVCAEMLAQEDELKYEEAYNQYNKYLIKGKETFDEETETQIKEKVDDMFYALSIVSKRKVTDYWMNGEWIFHRASGKTDGDYDIRVICQDGRYYADFKSYVVQSNYWEVISEEWKRVEMQRYGNTFSFNAEFSNIVVENPGTRKQFEQGKYTYRFLYELEFKNGDLVGTMTQTYAYSAIGSPRFKTCEQAIARGQGSVIEACSGNCGKSSVYFSKNREPESLNLPLDAARRFARAKIALSLAKEPNDYIGIAREFKNITYFQPYENDPAIHYLMGIAYQEASASDPEYCNDAIFALNVAEKNGEGILDASQLEDIRARRKALNQAIILSVKNDKNIISPSALCANWTFHYASGKTEELFDIRIEEKHGVYTVCYDGYEAEGGKVSPHMYMYKEIKQDGNTIRFSVVHNRGRFSDNRETYWFKQAMNYELVLLDGQLRGVAHITDIVEAYGHPDYSTVSRAMRDGEATVIQDKHGDCGTIEVYFTK